MLFPLELDDGCHRGATVVFLEEGCLKGLAWHAFEIPRLHNTLWAYDFAEFAVEAVFGAVRVYVGEAPSAAWADVQLLDGHLVFSGPHPLGDEFWISVSTEYGVAGRVEGPYYSDLGIVRSCDYGGFRDRL